MLSKIDAAAAMVIVNAGLLVTRVPEEMAKNVGRVVRYTNWKPNMGTVTRDFTFTIIGVQKDFKGDLVYRVICDGFNDTIGRCAAVDGIEFV